MTHELIRIIGLSHLLQPPLTLLLSGPRGINLRVQLLPTTPLAREVLFNAGIASVFLPTTLGVLVAYYPTSVLEPGLGHALGALISLFWCWRLYRQLFALSPLWPHTAGQRSPLDALLTLIFAVQGPGLGLLVIFG
jgi:hypothetical protein